ncbi:MAG: hypothetical protein K8R63_07540, partial [Bacteroidales bacterium]|nr:hypothetical protein [Bacteroidales bacterium]
MNEQENIYNPDIREESIDYKAIFLKFFRYWYFFLISIIIALTIAWLFNKFTKPVYEVSSTILIKDPGKADPQTLIGMGAYGRMQDNIQNEIVVIKSFSVVNRTIKKLDFYVSYFFDESFKTTELYNNNPFKVVFDTLTPQPVGLRFTLIPVGNNSFELSAAGENIGYYNYSDYAAAAGLSIPLLQYEEVHTFGEKIQTPWFSFTIVKTPVFVAKAHVNNTYQFNFNNIDHLTRRYRNVGIGPISQNASILKLSFKGNNPGKMVDFLNMLMREYLVIELEDKSKISQNTIEFINRELVKIEDSLMSSENELRIFMTENKVMNLESQTDYLFSTLYGLQNEKAAFLVKAKYYDHLKQYIEKDEGHLLIPSSMGIEDDVVSSQIQTLIGLYNERIELLSTSTEKNPYLYSLDEQIGLAKSTLIESVNSIISTSTITIGDIDERISQLYADIGDLPALDREFFNIQRRFGIKNSLYTFLLQKRSEAQISLASTFPD